jgi:hypothetical protein
MPHWKSNNEKLILSHAHSTFCHSAKYTIWQKCNFQSENSELSNLETNIILQLFDCIPCTGVKLSYTTHNIHQRCFWFSYWTITMTCSSAKRRLQMSNTTHGFDSNHLLLNKSRMVLPFPLRRNKKPQTSEIHGVTKPTLHVEKTRNMEREEGLGE